VIGPENRNRDLLAAMLEAGQSEDSEDEEGSVGSRERREVVLRLWAEGFTVDDGRLREYSDPANAQFLEKIRGGFIPEELVTEARGGTVHCRMEDHRSALCLIIPSIKSNLHLIVFWCILEVIHDDNNNRGFTRLSITNKTIDSIDRLNCQL
jgi:hypothetical protein